MDDLYCPACQLVLFGPAIASPAPRHCPRCAARALMSELRPRRGGAAGRGRATLGSLVQFYNAALSGRRPPGVHPR